jgi:hypothetical protein
VPLAVDEKGGRPGHAGQVGGIHVLRDVRRPGVVPEIATESFGIQTDLLGVAGQITGGELALVVEQQVVHGPERLLRGRGLGGLGRELRVGVDVG